MLYFKIVHGEDPWWKLWYCCVGAFDETNQEIIVASGGLTSLVMLLRSYEDETVRRVAAVAIANLAMNACKEGMGDVTAGWIVTKGHGSKCGGEGDGDGDRGCLWLI